MALLEAMACGMAVVASNACGMAEQIRIRGAGLIVPAGDPISLAGALQQLLSSASDRDALGRAARQLVCSEHSVGVTTGRLFEALSGARDGAHHG